MTAPNAGDTISTVAIAKLLGITPATITNWKSRKSDFPEPVAGNTRSPLYDRRQVLDWLIANDKATPEQLQNAGAKDLAFQLMDITRNLGVDTPVISAALCWVHTSRNETLPTPARIDGQAGVELADAVRAAASWTQTSASTNGVPIFAPLTNLVDSSRDGLRILEQVVYRLDKVQDLRAVHDALLDLTRSVGGRGEETLPPDVAAFVAQLLPAKVDRVIDSYCMGAPLLMACATHRPGVNLVAASPNSHALEAMLRAAIIADHPLVTVHGDLVFQDVLTGMRADAVVSNAPWGFRLQDRWRVLDTDPRWTYGTPRDVQWAVIQDAVHRLNPGGRALALCPSSLLIKGGADRGIRDGLLRAGCIEAVVSAPRGALNNTSLGFSVLVLRQSDTAGDDVLLIDIEKPRGRGSRPDFADAVQIYRQWTSTRTVDSDHAFRAPIADILAPQGTLDPAKWREAAHRPDSDAILTALTETQQKLATTTASPAPKLPAVTTRVDRASRVATIGTLTGLVVHRGASLDRRVRDTQPEDGVPVLTLGIIKGGSRAHEDIRHVDPTTVRGATPLTQRGDVIVHPTPTGIIAVVWDEPGWLVSSHTELLRVVDDAAFNPEYLALCLSSRLVTDPVTVGSVIPRAQIKNVSIPLMSLADQEAVAAFASRVAELSAFGERLTSESEVLRRALADAVADGIAVSSE